MMRAAFWASALFLAYTYFGYPLWLWVRSCFRPRPVQVSSYTPSLSIVMVVRNEAAVLERKLRNLLALNYPAELREIVVVSDGSSDATQSILNYHSAEPRVRVVLNTQSRGKAACLNDAISIARGEIVVFTDARQIIENGALEFLMQSFADPQVGCASGELMLGDPDSGESARGMGLYWRTEKQIREMESASGSVVGATGALYAARRNLLVAVPEGTILDDVYIPMQIARQGFRVVFVPSARAWDVADQGAEREFARKVRTLSGNYQLLQLSPWLLTGANPLRFEFLSHKICRLFAPFALITAFVGSLALIQQPIYRIALLLQMGFYGLSVLALAKAAKGPLARIADPARTFVVLNSAALIAFFKSISGSKVVWTTQAESTQPSVQVG